MIHIIKTTGYAYEDTDYGFHIKEKLAQLGYPSRILSALTDMEEIKKCIHEPLIITGGSTGVMEDFEWLHELRSFIKNRIHYHKNIPTLGICFGSQLLADVFDQGCVGPASTMNIGLKPISQLKSGEIFNTMESAYSFHFHIITSTQLEVFSAGIIGEDKFVNAFRIPDSNIFGTQFHPEFDEHIMKKLSIYYQNWLMDDFSIAIKDIPLGQENNRILEEFVALCSQKSRR
ncbi:MAG: hypothetical protein N4A64_06075 [Marinisporobacter sp.]|jgi:GMP synthase (glutamine-hydrolysing)|nr:hypothetical protein [Marinisporobacter sp.]